MRTTISTALSLLMLGSAAVAADVPRPFPVFKAPPPVAMLPTWTGFYLGANVGGALATGHLDFGLAGGPSFASINNSMSGVIGGGQIGYNWQFNSFVVGLETDFQGTGVKGSLDAPCPLLVCAPLGLSASYSQSVRWFGTARARVGYAQDSWFIYATGGYAYANLHTDAVATAGLLTAAYSANETRQGWTVGGGVEVALAANWSAKVEYLYMDLGNKRTTWTAAGIPLINDDARLTMNVVRAGVNYRF